jgi:hypothetical protein
MKLLLGMILCCVVLHAADYQRFDLPNGATVLYRGWRVPVGPFFRFPQVTPSGNGIRRVVTGDHGTLVAFEVLVDVLESSKGFRIRFAPVPGLPFFGRAPEPREVRAGDFMLVDVLEQPGTGKLMFDLLKVGFRDTPMTLLPMPSESAHVVGNGMILTLDRPELLDEHGHALANSKTKICGKHVEVTAVDSGHTVRFTLSTEPAPGFRLEAIVYAQKPRAILAFIDGDRTYYVTGASPILPQSGPALIWVRKEDSLLPSSGWRAITSN